MTTRDKGITLPSSYLFPRNTVGDGVTDDTIALSTFFSSAPAYSTIDLQGKSFAISSSLALANTHITIQNGKFVFLNNALQFFYALTLRDHTTLDNIHFLGAGLVGTAGAPNYQGGVFAGNTSYVSPMNVTPANYCEVKNCTFENLTVGCFIGGSSGDPTPLGWNVHHNKFINIVGYPGQSEGYGVLFTPASRGHISHNTFSVIRRHAVYLASNASNNTVDNNVIYGTDNIAIQSNTTVTQGYADSNSITNNVIYGFTRSTAYGYRSSIGIGLYGKFSNCSIQGNLIYGALDDGIDSSGELSGSAYADNISICNNFIVLDPTATDAGIRCDGVQSGKYCGNKIKIQNSNYGMVFTSTVTASTGLIHVSENTLETTNAGAQGFRVAFNAARVLHVYNNKLNGFPDYPITYQINDTSAAGTVRTDLNRRVGIVSTDANFTHNPDGTVANTDCQVLQHTGTLTAVRTITINETANPRDVKLRVSRTGAGAFNLNIVSSSAPGTVLKGLATGQWAEFAKIDSGAWIETAFGSL